MKDVTLLDDVILDNGLTERENYFLDILFDECSGDVAYAMKQAGYHKSVSPSHVAKKLGSEIVKRSKEYLQAQTGAASIALVRLTREGDTPGAANRIKAIESVLNRGGVNKEEERIEVKDNIMIMLPPKAGRVSVTVEEPMRTIDHEQEENDE